MRTRHITVPGVLESPPDRRLAAWCRANALLATLAAGAALMLVYVLTAEMTEEPARTHSAPQIEEMPDGVGSSAAPSELLEVINSAKLFRRTTPLDRSQPTTANEDKNEPEPEPAPELILRGIATVRGQRAAYFEVHPAGGSRWTGSGKRDAPIALFFEKDRIGPYTVQRISDKEVRLSRTNGQEHTFPR